MKDAVIIGGGVAGLAAALRLRRGGMEVTVLEAREHPGGNLRTVAEGDWRYDLGPHSFIPSADAIWELTADLALDDQVLQASSKSQARFIWREGRLMPLPMGIGSFLTTPLLSPGPNSA